MPIAIQEEIKSEISLRLQNVADKYTRTGDTAGAATLQALADDTTEIPIGYATRWDVIFKTDHGRWLSVLSKAVRDAGAGTATDFMNFLGSFDKSLAAT